MTTIMGYPISPLAYLFPLMTKREYRAFAERINARGLRMPIILWRRQVIDGQHHLLACMEAGVAPAFVEIPDNADPIEYLFDLNQTRRRMNESQRAVVAYRVWEESRNGWQSLKDFESANLHSYTLDEVANLFKVRRGMIAHAGKVAGR